MYDRASHLAKTVTSPVALGVLPALSALLLAGLILLGGLDVGGGEKDAYLGIGALCWAPIFISVYCVGLWRRWRPTRAALVGALVAGVLLIPAVLILLQVVSLLK